MAPCAMGGKRYFDHTNDEALEQPVLGIAVQFIEDLGKRFEGVGDTMSDIFGGCTANLLRPSKAERRCQCRGVVCPRRREHSGARRQPPQLWRAACRRWLLAGMLVPREVRVYLENLAEENRAAAAVKLEAARAALAAESGRATYANPAFEGETTRGPGKSCSGPLL